MASEEVVHPDHSEGFGGRAAAAAVQPRAGWPASSLTNAQMSSMFRSALLSLILLSAAALPGPAQAASKATLERGAAIARQNCGGCHAVGRAGASPNPKSPLFRELSRRYPLANLEEALGEGIVVGHEGLEMPRFQFSSSQVEALLAYLGSIQRR